MSRTGITEIYLQNFKGISEKVRIPLKPITLLFGPNSTGKSTINHALHYARELLLNDNPNADNSDIGGNAIDLGGFQNLVHNHDMSKDIKIGFTIIPDSKGIPSSSDLFQRYFDSDLKDSFDLSKNINNFKIELTISWDDRHNTPYVSHIEFFFNNQGTINFYNYNSEDPAELNICEASFCQLFESNKSISQNISIEYLKKNYDGLLYSGYKLSGIDTTHPFDIDISGTWDQVEAINMVLNQLVQGTLKLLKEQLKQFRYLGPIRHVPKRGFSTPSRIDEKRWFDGLAAWDLLYHDESLIKLSNKYLSDKYMKSGYQIVLFRYEEDYLADDLLQGVNVDFRVKKRIELVDTKRKILVTAKDIGVGISQVIPVIVGAVDNSKKIFSIEQPELHLHPKAQCSLADIFIEEINNDNGRIFLIETHSEHLVLRFLRRIRETAILETHSESSLVMKPNDLGVLYVHNPDNKTEIIELPVNEEGEFTVQWPSGFFEERAEELF